MKRVAILLRGALILAAMPASPQMASARSSEAHNLFLIGTIHSYEARDYEKSLIKRAVRGELAVGIESVERDEAKELSYVRRIHKLDSKGLVFGLENGLAHAFSGLLLRYGFMEEFPFPPIMMKLGFVYYDLKENAALQKSWERLRGKVSAPPARSLYSKLDDYLAGHPTLDADDLARYLASLDEGNPSWKTLFKELAYALMDDVRNLPVNQQLDLNRVTDYLEDPANPRKQAYAVNDVNLHWRNRYLIENIRAIAVLAAQRGVDLYILVGKDHLQELGAALRAVESGLVKKLCYDAAPQGCRPSLE